MTTSTNRLPTSPSTRKNTTPWLSRPPSRSIGSFCPHLSTMIAQRALGSLHAPQERVKLRKLAKDTDLSEGVHVIKFFADWCGPCKLYAPAFERVAAQFPEANFYAVDVDEQEEMKALYEVDTLPTTVI